MAFPRKNRFVALIAVIGLLGACFVTADDAEKTTDSPATASAPVEPDVAGKGDKSTEDEIPRVSLEVARDRARLMHDLYSSTLDAMHHRYFHGDRAMVPARAMEDVFKEMQRRDHSQSRWISASFSPMSIDHEPKSDFEKLAAEKIAKGEELVESVDEGYYRRAGSISLNRGCISCHSGVFASTSSDAKFAGLVISIPVDAGVHLPMTTDKKDSQTSTD